MKSIIYNGKLYIPMAAYDGSMMGDGMVPIDKKHKDYQYWYDMAIGKESKSIETLVEKAKPKKRKPINKKKTEFVFRQNTRKYEAQFQKTLIEYFQDQEKAALTAIEKDFDDMEQKIGTASSGRYPRGSGSSDDSGKQRFANGGSFEYVGNPPNDSTQSEYAAHDGDGKKVGRFVISKNHGKKEIHIHEAFVEISDRGQGIGNKFLEYLASKNPNMRTFVAHAEPDAITYWQKMGFKKMRMAGNTTYMTRSVHIKKSIGLENILKIGNANSGRYRRGSGGQHEDNSTDNQQSYGNTAKRQHLEAIYKKEGLDVAIKQVIKDTGFSDVKAGNVLHHISLYSAKTLDSARGGYSINSKLIDEFIKASPKFEGKLYRGVRFSTNVREGDIIGGKNFSSWTSSSSTATDFSRRRDSKGNYCVMELGETNAGASIKHLSRNPYENEVLISRNAKMQVAKVEVIDKQNIDGKDIKEKRVTLKEYIEPSEVKALKQDNNVDDNIEWMTIEEKWDRDINDDLFFVVKKSIGLDNILKIGNANSGRYRRGSGKQGDQLLKEAENTVIGFIKNSDGQKEMASVIIDGHVANLKGGDHMVHIPIVINDKMEALVHNHPTSSSFSGEDLQLFIRCPKMTRMEAIGSDGSKFIMKKTPEAAKELEKLANGNLWDLSTQANLYWQYFAGKEHKNNKERLSTSGENRHVIWQEVTDEVARQVMPKYGIEYSRERAFVKMDTKWSQPEWEEIPGEVYTLDDSFTEPDNFNSLVSLAKEEPKITKASPNALPDRFDFSGWAYKDSKWNKRLQEEGGLFIKEIYDLEGKRVWEELSYAISNGLEGAFDIDDPLIAEFIDGYSYKFAQEVNGYTVELLQDAMLAGTGQGLGMDGIAKLIRDVFDNCSKYRSLLIARTETIRASNGAAQAAYEQSGVVTGKEWLTTEDDRLCSWCTKISGQVRKINENYFSLGDKLTADGSMMIFDYEDVPFPPLHPNCRCTIVPIISEEYQLPKSIGIGTIINK